LYGIEWYSWRELERMWKKAVLRRTNVEISLGTMKTIVGISDIRANISTWELPNAKECYHSTTKCDCYIL
jgi:hypothetical protein